MYHFDLGQLVQKLKENKNGIAQDRLILCDIYTKLINHRDISHSRFQDAMVRFAFPHKNALIQRYERKHDYAVAQSKRNLIHTWDAFQCYVDLGKEREVPDHLLKRSKLMSMHRFIQKGDFNFVLTPDELDNVINIVSKYADDPDPSNHLDNQQIQSDYDFVVNFIGVLR